jgi:membrane protease YdiL (CAAX protease family)
LTLLWRRTGNLAASASAHALIDAVRNALVG